MGSDEAREDLVKAIEHLRRHSDHASCSWCKSKGEAIMGLAQELLEVSPVAHELSQKVDSLRQERIQELSKTMKVGGVDPVSEPPVRDPQQPPRLWRDRPAATRLYGRDRRDGRGRGILPRRGGRHRRL